MHDQALVWNTDSNLQVTSLTARLRDIAGVGSCGGSLSVSDLWGQIDPFAMAVVSHHWALDGETLTFEAPIRDVAYRFEIAPLFDLAGSIVGVSGRAIEVREAHPLHEALGHVERAVGLGTWYEDLRTGLVTVSEGLARLLGTTRYGDQLDVRSHDHPDDREYVARTIADRAGDNGYSVDHRVLCADGRVRAVRERLRIIFDNRGMAIARIGTIVDISDLKEREAELSELAHHDALTRLPNRAALEERLAMTIARSDRNQRRGAVLFIDLDDFKAINDAHGHAVGDRVLVEVAERLGRHVRASDTVARYGGDEFVVLIDDLFTDDAGVDAARKILHSFDEPFLIGPRSIGVSASIGIATYPRCGATPQELLAAADREMYVVKRNGGSGIKLAPAREESAVATTEKTACQVPSSPAHHLFATLESV
ncbi:MAG TPA: diguanylate cyclase [Candidatus Baltobacteraceae bacterium]|nr:diguanylate cyclase [Candidatus Baltobacteraceae bacterium]